MTAPARKVVRRKAIQGGEPCLEGTRIPSESIRHCFMGGWSRERIVAEYNHPRVDAEAVEIALRYEMRRRRK